MLVCLLSVILMDKVIMPYYVRLGNEVVLPNVQGMNIIEAQKILEKNKFQTIIKERRFHSSFDKNTVMTQNPFPGTKVKEGRKVYLVISIGDKPIIVPDFRGYTQQQAEIKCNEVGLNLVETKYEYNGNYQPNIVFDQSLEPNTEVEKNTKISLTVSFGKNPNEKFNVPNFIGWDFEKAKNKINNLGLNIGSVIKITRTDLLPNTIIRQERLKPNTEAFPGDTIDFIITR